MFQQIIFARKMVSIVVPLLMVMALLIAGAGTQAVGTSASGDVPFCYSDELLAESLRANPELQKTLDAQEEAIRNYVENPPSKRNKPRISSSNYIIPVVVYVVHNGGPENITDLQVNSQIAALNTAFGGHGIEFCLATQQGGTPLPGITTPGIIRKASLLTNHHTSDESLLKNLVPPLPGDRYLRIWVVQNIDNGTPTSGVVGYARFPGSVPTQLEGIVMRYDVFGNVLDATCGCPNLIPNYDRGKILAHEVGHYLNLYHTFQGGCSGMFPSDCATAGDRVCDTPQIAVADSACPPPNTVLSCDGTPALIDNEMDYTNDVCRSAFTAGQDTRMLATLNIARQLLVSPQNLVFTGVQCTGLLNASFSASNYNPCTNQSVTFDALHIIGANYVWDFGDSSLPVSGINLFSVTHSYASAGTYNVTLTVTSGGNSVSSTQQIFVTACTPINSSQGNWYFADRAGLNFSTGAPMPDTNSIMSTIEGVVTQSAANGSLLFYSDSANVYNKIHAPMNSGSPLNGNVSNSQSCISVPDPTSLNRYYLFTLGPNDSGSARLWYTIVDFPTSSSTGVLTSVNTPVSAVGINLTEQITAVPNCDSSGHWIIVHQFNPSRFLVYTLTAAGVTGPSTYNAQPGTYGTIKASPDGAMLAQSTLTSNGGPFFGSAALYTFNRTTGAIALRTQLMHGSYGCSFSPDSKLLYVGEYPPTFVSPPASVYQYDVADPNPDNSVQLVAPVPTSSPINLQLGPDKKIYASSGDPNTGIGFLHVINYPNKRNTSLEPNACGYNYNGPDLAGRRAKWGLPNMIDALPVAQIPADFSYVVSSCSTVNFTAPPCATYAWDFGDGTTSNAQNPTHTFAANGTYLVTLTLNGSTTVTHTIAIGLPVSAATIFGPSHVCLASGNPPFYNYSANAQPGLTYNWTVTGGSISGISGSDNVDVVWTTLPGTVQLTVTDPATGCTATKTLTVIENCKPNQCVPPPSAMVNWWTFDETSGTTAQDIAGSVNNAGTHVNGPTPVAGVVAGALYFNGMNWVEVASHPEVNFLGGCILDFAEPMTIDLWVKTDIQPGTGAISGLLTILDKRVNTGNPAGYHLFLFNGRLGFQIDGINYVAPATGLDYVDVADNQWHFVAVSLPTCRGVANGFLYVDGKPVLTLPRGLGFDNTATLYIGRRDPLFTANFFKGSLDELEMFKRNLSDDELRAIFEARSLGKCKVNCTPVFTNGCPAPVTVTAQASCPYATATLVNYAIPTVTDNCSTATVSCNPPPGSMFPVGTTTVTCTATDPSGNIALCTFTVSVFSFCLQDETISGNVVLVNALTGDYSFCCGGALIASGRGTLTTKGCIGSIDHFKGDRKVHIQWDTSANSGAGAGTAYVQKPLGGSTICQITDKKLTNNTCQCF